MEDTISAPASSITDKKGRELSKQLVTTGAQSAGGGDNDSGGHCVLYSWTHNRRSCASPQSSLETCLPSCALYHPVSSITYTTLSYTCTTVYIIVCIEWCGWYTVCSLETYNVCKYCVENYVHTHTQSGITLKGHPEQHVSKRSVFSLPKTSPCMYYQHVTTYYWSFRLYTVVVNLIANKLRR